MRTGRSKRSAASTIISNWRSRFSPKPTLPGLMRNLARAARHLRIVGQQPMAVVVEVADQRHGVAQQVQPLADRRDGAGGLVVVDRDPDDLGAGACQLDHLGGGGGDVGRVGVGHRLDDHRRTAADGDVAHAHGVGLVPRPLAQCHHVEVRDPPSRATGGGMAQPAADGKPQRRWAGRCRRRVGRPRLSASHGTFTVGGDEHGQRRLRRDQRPPEERGAAW